MHKAADDNDDDAVDNECRQFAKQSSRNCFRKFALDTDCHCLARPETLIDRFYVQIL